VEQRRRQQIQPEFEEEIRVAYLPLPIYDDEAFLKLRNSSDVRRTLKLEAYPMFVRDVQNRAAVYLSHFLDNYTYKLFSCGGLLPTAKMDGSDLLLGKGPEEDHLHDGVSCIGTHCVAAGLRTGLEFPLEQKVRPILSIGVPLLFCKQDLINILLIFRFVANSITTFHLDSRRKAMIKLAEMPR
jgi:hypothetical protein